MGYSKPKQAGADIAIGSGALDRSLVGVHQSAFRELSGRCFNVAMRAITGLPFKTRSADSSCFVRGRRARFWWLGYRAVEVPVIWNNVEGTKVSALAGVSSFAAPLGIRWRGITGR